MRQALLFWWQELRDDEPLERGPGLVIAAASAYPIVWLIVAGGAYIGWW